MIIITMDLIQNATLVTEQESVQTVMELENYMEQIVLYVKGQPHVSPAMEMVTYINNMQLSAF